MQIRFFIGTGVVVASLLSGIAHAQTTADSSGASAPASSDKKVQRLQNRQTSKSVRHALTATKGLVSSNIAILVNAAKGVPQVHTVDNRLLVEEEGH
jgi:hyperosmotically inducible protein